MAYIKFRRIDLLPGQTVSAWFITNASIVNQDTRYTFYDSTGNIVSEYIGTKPVITSTELTKAEVEAVLTGTITSHTHTNASQSTSGLMSASDKTKLDGIATNATANEGTVTNVSAGTTQVSGLTLSVANGTTTPIITTSISNAGNFRAAIGAGTSNLALGETSSTAYRGDRGKTAYNHSQTAHAPSNAQKNSDITKAEIEAKLTGSISSHTHTFSSLTSKPTTVAGYGITDAYTKTEVDTGLATKANVSHTHTVSQITDATTLGQNLVKLANGSAISFPRFNANNTVSKLSAADFRAAIGAGTSSTTGTVTSVGLTVPTGLSVSGSPITTNGTLGITFASGYSIPTTAKQGNWDTAYGWGNHASAGYITSNGISGMTSGQVAIAGSGSTIIGSRAIDTTSGGTLGSTSLITSGAVFSGLATNYPEIIDLTGGL